MAQRTESSRKIRNGKAARALDRTDHRILLLLQENARLSNKEIARTINLSPTPCLRRISLLEKAGYITRYKAVLDPAKLGFSIHAFLSLKRSRESSREEISRQIMAIPEVLTCHVVSGEFDLLVELVARDMDDYARITIDHIAEMPGIYDLRSTFSIKALRRDGDLPINDAGAAATPRGRPMAGEREG
jgi:Lrp/AsnC family leucine-responsive transcriptional regulator